MCRSTKPGFGVFTLSRGVPAKKGRIGGFTLIEVLVALAVVATALGAIGGLMASNVRATRAFDQRLALTETARSVLAGLPKTSDLTPGGTSGEIDGHRWRIDISPLGRAEADSRNASLWQSFAIAIRVQAPTGQTVRLDTVRLRRIEGDRQ